MNEIKPVSIKTAKQRLKEKFPDAIVQYQCDVLFATQEEVSDLRDRIKQLELELANAKQDQARYYWMQDWIENKVKGTKEFFRAKTRSDFDTSIDAAIVAKESSK